MTYTIGNVVNGTSTNTLYSWQKHSFYAQGLFWQFWYYSPNTSTRQVKYATSSDGITWSAETIVLTGLRRSAIFALWYDTTSNKLATTYIYSTTTCRYRQGTPNGDGTITWGSDVTVATGSLYNQPFPNVCIDSDGYPWVTYHIYPNSYVKKANDVNGTSWGSASIVSTYGNNFGIKLLPLTNGKILIVGSIVGGQMISNLFNGSTWEGAIYASTIISNGYCWDAIADGDNAAMVFTNNNINVIFSKYTYGIGWGSEETISTTAHTSSAAAVILCLNPNYYRIFWHGNDNSVKCINRINGSYLNEEIIATKNITYTINSFPKPYNNMIAIVWRGDTYLQFAWDYITFPYRLDTDLLKYGIIKTVNVDTTIMQTLTKSNNTDIILKKLGITKTDSIDTLIQKQNLTKISNFDLIILKHRLLNNNLDVCLADYRCTACRTYKAVYIIRITGQALCGYCYFGKATPHDNKIHQSTDYSTSVTL